MDIEKKEAFGNRMVAILNHGALNLALAIGYELEIFEAMEDETEPMSARELAKKTGLNPRYIKEWLGIMVTGEILDLHTDEGGKEGYSLPLEHAAVLTRNAGAGNMGVYTQEIPLLTRIAHAAVVKDFKEGQGIPFSAYPRFQDFMGELSDAKHETVLVDQFLPQVDDGILLERLKAGIR
ncbi:MAG: methyltransferase type 12, partial [Desulfobacterales bacterium]|nr:methyltransferase type 12 [Desulfobacterales bacterium]